MYKTRYLLLVLALAITCIAAQADMVRMEKVEYGGWPNCIRLTNGEIELIATTDVGPRIIRFGFVDGENLFKEFEEQMGGSGEDEWRIRGGHRLWHAPEAIPRSYGLDNTPIDYDWSDGTLTLIQPTEPATGIQKTIEVTMDGDTNHAEVLHRLVNENLWPVELAPWALTVMTTKGRAYFPQPSFRPHSEYVLPARPLVFWHYTDMSDPRWTWGDKYIQLEQDTKADGPTKVGLQDHKGWLAYNVDGDLFVKRYGFVPGAEYPDYGCNAETFTNSDMLEVETLGPITELAPGGGALEHIEHWFLFDADVPKKDSKIDHVLLPLIEKADEIIGN